MMCFLQRTSFTILTFFTNYEIEHSSCWDECNLNKARVLLHPNVPNDNFPQQIFMIKRPVQWCLNYIFNACGSISWPCSYKCNFPSMLAKTIVEKVLIFMHLTFKFVIINIQCVKNMVNISFTYKQFTMTCENFVKMSKMFFKTPLE